MINIEQNIFKYNSRDLVYIIFPNHESIVHSFKKSHGKVCRTSGVYKIIDPPNYLWITLDGKMLRGLFEHQRLKSANIRTNEGNAQNLAQLKQVMNVGFQI